MWSSSFCLNRRRKGGSVCDDNEYRCRISGDLSSPDHFKASYVDEFKMVDELGATEAKDNLIMDGNAICAEAKEYGE